MIELGLRISMEVFIFSHINQNEEYFMYQLELIRRRIWDCLISF